MFTEPASLLATEYVAEYVENGIRRKFLILEYCILPENLLENRWRDRVIGIAGNHRAGM